MKNNILPLISIIIPVYNVEKYLRECLDSVLAQTYKNLEVILIDDGSPDSCGKICDEYAAKDNRIKVIHQTNQGVSAARNVGLDAARGEYIGFVDSDDYIQPDMYEYLYQLISKDNADIAMCNVIQTDTFKSTSPIQENYRLIKNKDLFDYSDWMYLVNKLFKNTIFKNLSFQMGASAGEDSYIMFHIIKNISLVALGKESKYYYRPNSSSATHVWRTSHLKELRFFEEWLEYAKEENLTEFYHNELRRRNYHIVRWLSQLSDNPLPNKDVINQLTSYIRKNWRTSFLDSKIDLKIKCFLALCCINFPLASKIYQLLKGKK